MSMFNPLAFEEIGTVLKKNAPTIVSAADDLIPMAMNSLNNRKKEKEPLAKLNVKQAGNFADSDGNIYDTGQITLATALKHLGTNTAVGTGIGGIGGAGIGALLAQLGGGSPMTGAKVGGTVGAGLGALGGAYTGAHNELKPVGKIDYKKALAEMNMRKQAGFTGGALGLGVGSLVAPFTSIAGGVGGALAGKGIGAGIGGITGLITALLKGRGKNLNPQVLDRVGSKFKPVESLGSTVKRHVSKGADIGTKGGLGAGAFAGAYYPMHQGIRAGSGLEDLGRANYEKNK